MGAYGYCEVCKRNHNDGKRHLYSKAHQEKLDTLIGKQIEKYKKFKIFLKEATPIIDETKQPELWCIFCEREIFPSNLEEESEEFHLVCSHIFEHMADREHQECLNKYFNKFKVKHQYKEEFKLSLDKLKNFYQRGEKKIQELKVKLDLEKKRREIAEKTHEIQARMAQIPIAPQFEQPIVHETVASPLGVLQNPTGWHHNHRVWGGGIVKYKQAHQWIPWPIDLDDEGRDTTVAYMGNWALHSKGKVNSDADENDGTKFDDEYVYKLSGYDSSEEPEDDDVKDNPRLAPRVQAPLLTAIQVPPLKTGESNVYTEGSVPPWLRADDEPEGSSKSTIGPSMDIFLKAKELERKAKLNPERIGAGFDRTKKTGKYWVPNFGRVWNSGTRNDTRKEFLRETRKK
ncbi:Coiled-coil domain-containing protein 84 [Basidiobolus ranarum]|uniref:Coiled-coil domain-containing protein 84 n=2 Tax=Basidiobolus ranarum TaxID=34480 RepID=A0ABR2W547_9FUNG